MTTALVLAPGASVLARQTIAGHSKSFELASRLLPARTRDQVAVLYAWCRRADDAVDHAPDRGSAAAAVVRLRDELDAIYAGTATDPMLAAFSKVVHARNIPRCYPRALLAGIASDVDPRRYSTIADLAAYAYRVAGVVGLMMAHVFGVRDDAALVPAAHLGIAMQLTNVCRDVAEDWQRGRLYVPDEVLAAHGAGGLWRQLGRGMPLPERAKPALAASVHDLLALADRFYRSGDRGVRALPWRAALAVVAARAIYAAIGARLERRGYDVAAGRAFVSRNRKLALLTGAAVRLIGTWPARLFAGPLHVPARVLVETDACTAP